MPVTAVVFDVGRVLVEWDLRLIFSELITDPAELDWFIGNVVTDTWHYQTDLGRPLAEMVAERSAEFPRYADLIAIYAERFNDSIPGLVPGIFEIVQALHSRGVPLHIITNFGAELWARFRSTQPVFDLFGKIVVSGEEKIAKPDHAIYQIAAQRFGHAPEEMLFIDDKLPNIEAARACGWHGHHFIDSAGLALDLKERGLI